MASTRRRRMTRIAVVSRRRRVKWTRGQIDKAGMAELGTAAANPEVLGMRVPTPSAAATAGPFLDRSARALVRAHEAPHRVGLYSFEDNNRLFAAGRPGI